MDESAPSAGKAEPADAEAEAEASPEQDGDRTERAKEERLTRLGMRSQSGAWLILNRTSESLGFGSEEEFRKARTTVEELIGEMEPTSPIETMLVSQMIATHFGALNVLGAAMLPNQDHRVVDKAIAQSAKFMQLFVRQLEALSKLRGMDHERKNETTGNQGGAEHGNFVRNTERPSATPLLKGNAGAE